MGKEDDSLLKGRSAKMKYISHILRNDKGTCIHLVETWSSEKLIELDTCQTRTQNQQPERESLSMP